MGAEDTLTRSEYRSSHIMSVTGSPRSWGRLKASGLSAGVTEAKLGTRQVERYWRDQNQALMSACCEKGCHRRDLTTLC